MRKVLWKRISGSVVLYSVFDPDFSVKATRDIFCTVYGQRVQENTGWKYSANATLLYTMLRIALLHKNMANGKTSRLEGPQYCRHLVYILEVAIVIDLLYSLYRGVVFFRTLQLSTNSPIFHIWRKLC